MSARLGLRVCGLVGAALVAGACEAGGLVGGECVEGLTECRGKCVDVTTDAQNCGACGVVCPAGRACVRGEYCARFGEGVAGAAGSDGTAGSGGHAGAAAAAGAAGVAGAAGAAGTEGAAGGCTGPFDTAEQCGDCDTQCGADTPLCECAGAACDCVASCSGSLDRCSGSCVDLQTNPAHCGACGRECPTRVCQSGTCVGAAPGHIVLICMDYGRASATHPQTTLLGNAVFQARERPVRVLAYAEYATSAAERGVVATLDAAAAADSRAYALSWAASASEVADGLSAAESAVLLVLDQPGAPAGELAALGAAWQTELDGFVRTGGVVVVLDSAAGRGEMPELVTAAGLMAIDGSTPLGQGSLLYNRARIDSVGLNVLSPFLPLSVACTFSTSEAADQSTVFVVTDSEAEGDLGSPVAIHRAR